MKVGGRAPLVQRHLLQRVDDALVVLGAPPHELLGYARHLGGAENRLANDESIQSKPMDGEANVQREYGLSNGGFERRKKQIEQIQKEE